MKPIKEFVATTFIVATLTTIFLPLSVYASLASVTENSFTGNAIFRNVTYLCSLVAEHGDNSSSALRAFCGTALRSPAPNNNTCRQPPTHYNLKHDLNASFFERLIIGKRLMRSGLENPSKAIFILGNHDIEISTVAHILTGDFSQLYTSQNENGKTEIFDTIGDFEFQETEIEAVTPELIISSDTQTAFWKVPGFEENKTTELDIASMYFLKTVLDSTSLAKLLFVIDYSSVYDVNNLEDFDNFASHASKLLKNPDAFINSIGFVVTNVPSFSSDGEYLSNEMIAKQILNFLQYYAKRQAEDIRVENSANEKTETEKKQRFVEIVMDNVPARTALVRTPLRCGYLSEISSFSEAKQMLTKLYQENLEYSAVDSYDFDATFSKKEAVERTVSNTTQQLLHEIKLKVENSAENAISQFRKKFQDTIAHRNAHVALEMLNNTRQKLDYAVNRLYAINVENRFSEQLAEVLSAIGVPSNSKDNCLISAVNEMELQLEFFEMLSEQKSTKLNPLWIQPLENLLAEVNDIYKFYEFCHNLNLKLSSYATQQALEKLSVEPKSVPFLESKQSLLHFLKEYKLLEIPDHLEKQWQENLSSIDFKYLANLIRDQLPNTKISCESSFYDKQMYRLMISGKNVKFSDFLNSTDSWPWPCSDPEKLKEINILTSGTLFLDQDLIADCKTLQVSILAPKWQIIGDIRNIFLGCTQQHQYSENATDGKHYSDWGQNGQDGKPGVNAGSFYGVFSEIENAENLFINADGGNGGDGQNGGRGHDGKPGKKATREKFPNAYGLWTSGLWKGTLEKGYMTENGMDNNKLYLGVYNKAWYTKLGGNGTYGGNGGRGGDGGAPGNPGNILLINLKDNQNDTQVITSAKPGKMGEPGIGGEPGLGGMGGQHYSCRHNDIPMFVVFFWSHCYATENKDRAEAGVMGEDGEYSVGFVEREKPYEYWKIVNEYKKEFWNKSSKLDFVNEMERNKQIVGILSPLAFAEEFEFVENKYFARNSEHAQNTDMFYDEFMDRLKLFADIADISEKGDKIALNYLYAGALGKIVAKRQNGNTLNVIHTESYFDAVLRQLDILKDSQKSTAIAVESTRYENKLHDKINEAKKFVNELVLPALKNAESELDRKYEELIQETNHYLEQANEDLEKREQLKTQFENMLPLRYLMGGLRLAGQTCYLLGPVGAVVGESLSAVSSVAEPLLLQNLFPKISHNLMEGLPEGYPGIMESYAEEYFKERIDKFEKKVNLTLEALQEGGDDVKELVQHAEKVGSTLEKLSNSSIPLLDRLPVLIELEEVGSQLGGAIWDLLTGQSKVSEKSESKPDTEFQPTQQDEPHKFLATLETDKIDENTNVEEMRSHKTESILKNLAKGIEAVSIGADFIQISGIHSKHSERMNQLISSAEKKVRDAEAKKMGIYKELLPNLLKIGNELKQETSSISKQSHVGLEVKRWKVQSRLKTMKRYLDKFTEGLKVHEELKLSVDRMEEAINLLISLYDNIERYQEKKELADYIANINSASDQKAEIGNADLRRLVEKIEFSMQANLFFGEYQKAIKAFKQWVFPFAANYLSPEKDENRLLEKIKGGSDYNKTLNEAVGIYKRKVENLGVQLKKYYASTTVTDESLIVAQFVGGRVSTRPFFVWTNDKWQQNIEKLLAGEKVHLRANPEDDPETWKMLEGKAAVKYKSIELNFRAIDSDLQSELDEALNHFQMKMTHSGISTYEVLGQNYIMFDANQTYRYSFERHGQGNEALSKNVVYKKVQGKADFLLSPYTWWYFQLIDLTPESGVGFRDLKRRFARKVNLELEGEGVYLDVKHTSREKLQELDLDKYYEPFDKTVDYFERVKEYNNNAEKC